MIFDTPFTLNDKLFELLETKSNQNRTHTLSTYKLRDCVDKRLFVKCLLGREEFPEDYFERFFDSQSYGNIIKSFYGWKTITPRRKARFNIVQFLYELLTDGSTHFNYSYGTETNDGEYFGFIFIEYKKARTELSSLDFTQYFQFNKNFQEEYIQKTHIKPRLNLIGWRMAKRAEMGLGR